MNLKKVATILEENPDLLVRQIILDTAQKRGQIIHGTRGLNPQLPTYLQKETEDYDILSKKPKKEAKEVLDKLNKSSSKKFELKKGVHKGTYKIKLNDKTIADYTQLKYKPKTKKIYGIEHYGVQGIKRNIQRRLKDPSKNFRSEKDLDSLKRIQQSERKFDRL